MNVVRLFFRWFRRGFEWLVVRGSDGRREAVWRGGRGRRKSECFLYRWDDSA